MPHHSVSKLILIFALGRISLALTFEDFAGPRCQLNLTESLGTEETPHGKNEPLPRKIHSPNPIFNWLSLMNIRAPPRWLNGTKATAYEREFQGWKIMASDLDWWKNYYAEPWTLDEERNRYPDNPLDYIQRDLNNYSEVAFPCSATVSMEHNAANITQYGRNVSHYGTNFIDEFIKMLANKGLPPQMSDETATQMLRDQLQKASQEASMISNVSRWKMVTSYMGVGYRVDCWGDIDQALDNATEWDKAASSAATTLMALIPVLLTFGNLILPRDSEAFCSSLLVGIMSAAFSLGLPGKSISSVIRKMHRIDVGLFEHYGQDNISKLGRRHPASGRAQPKAFFRVPLSGLRSWVTAPPQDDEIPSGLFIEVLECSPAAAEQRACSNTFWNIRSEAEKWDSRRRTHFWHVLSLTIFCLQVGIFIVGVGPLFINVGTPLLMFSCENYLSSLWMLITAAINAVFRFLMWEFSAHERVRVYSLSENAKKTLGHLIGNPENDPAEGSQGILGSTETDLPPRYHPIVTRMILTAQRSVLSAKRPVSKQYSKVKRHSHSDKGDASAPREDNEDFGNLYQWIRNQFTFFWILWVQHPLKNPLQFIRIGLSCINPPSSARRWRPLTVLLHLSSPGRNPFSKLLTGLVEGTILLLLTIFFASQWGGNIVVVSYTIAMLLFVVTVGRFLSLFYIWQSAYTLGLHVIECQSKDQISGCLRILCSMSDVLVVVNGAYYYGGHRLDLKQDWLNWRKQYDSGYFDEVDNDPSTKSTEESDEEGRGHTLEPVRRASSLSWRYHGRGGSDIALRDLSVGPHGRSQISSDRSRDSSTQRVPDALARHEIV